MRYPQAHTVLEACSLEGKEFEAGSIDAVLVSKPDGMYIRVAHCACHDKTSLCYTHTHERIIDQPNPSEHNNK